MKRSTLSNGTKVEYIQSPNCFTKKQAPKRWKPISLVVLHYTASPDGLNGDISWFKNPAAKASAHYLIGKDGRTVQMVSEEDRAYHAGVSSWDGRSDCNAYSIGIELDGMYNDKWSDKQLKALYVLCADLMQEYDLGLDDFVGHEHVAPKRKTDPGPSFNWELFRKGVRAVIAPETVSTQVKNATLYMDPIFITSFGSEKKVPTTNAIQA